MQKIFLIFFGPPGSGKGTQAEMLAEKLNLPFISTGNIFRHEVETGSELGKLVEPIMLRGELVGDDILKKIILKRLKRDDAKYGAVFDGYPRNIDQQEFLIKYLKQLSNEDSKILAVLVAVSDKEVMRRLGGRRICECGTVYHIEFNPPRHEGVCDECGKKIHIRDDDRVEVIRERLKLQKVPQELLDYWNKHGKLIKINGEQSINEVYKDVISELKNISVLKN